MVNNMFYWLQQNKKYLKIISIIILMILSFGVIYYLFLSVDSKENITNILINYNNFRYNAIIKDLIIMSSLLVTSIIIIGVPLCFIYVFYDFFSIGFLFASFGANFGINGLIYIFVYILINKFIGIIITLFFIRRLFDISRYVIGIFLYKNNVIKNKLILSISYSMYLIIILLIVNILLFFISPSVLGCISGLLK